MSIVMADDRIVSLAPVATELIHVLGREDDLVGLTNICEYSGTSKITRLGAYSAVSPEAVFDLHPTLVVLTEGAENQASMFRDLGLSVVEIKTSSLAHFKSSALSLADVLSVGDKMKSIIEDRDREVLRLRDEKVDTERVLVLFGEEGSHLGAQSYYAIGRNTFYNELLSNLGFDNELPQEGYNIISLEGVCTLRPTCIVVASDEVYDGSVSAIRKCQQKAKIVAVSKSPFLYPGIKYAEIAKSLSACNKH